MADPYNLTGGYLSQVEPATDHQGKPCLKFAFCSAGGQLLAKLTGDRLPDKTTGLTYKLGIILDGTLWSWPNIMSTISDRCELTGSFTPQETSDLVRTLNAGALPIRLQLVQVIPPGTMPAATDMPDVTTAEGPLQVSSLPAGWKLRYNGSNGINFYSVTPAEEGSGVLMFSRWPPPSKPEDIPTLLRQIADGFVNKAKKSPGVALTSEKYAVEQFVGDHCTGSYAVFPIKGAGIQAMFMMSVDGQTWNGQFTGKPDAWREALKLLKNVRSKGVGQASAPTKPEADRIELTATESPFTARLPNGVTVELYGISEYPSKDRPWWSPDGSPLADRPRDWLDNPTVPSMIPSEDQIAREIAVRLHNPPPEPVGTKWQFESSGDSVLGSIPVGPSEHIEELRAGIALQQPAAKQTLTIRLGVAASPWHTCGQSEHFEGGGFRVGKAVATLSSAFEKDGYVAITVSHNIPDLEVRIMAVGTEGQEYRGHGREEINVTAFQQITTIFPKVSLKDITAFRLQTRPYEWVEFRNVSLHPGQKTDVQAVTSDAPASVDGAETAKPEQSPLPRPMKRPSRSQTKTAEDSISAEAALPGSAASAYRLPTTITTRTSTCLGVPMSSFFRTMRRIFGTSTVDVYCHLGLVGWMSVISIRRLGSLQIL